MVSIEAGSSESTFDTEVESIDGGSLGPKKVRCGDDECETGDGNTAADDEPDGRMSGVDGNDDDNAVRDELSSKRDLGRYLLCSDCGCDCS